MVNSDSSASENQIEVGEEYGELILEKQFEATNEAQKKLLVLLRTVMSIFVVLVAAVSLLLSDIVINVLPPFNKNFELELVNLNDQFILDLGPIYQVFNFSPDFQATLVFFIVVILIISGIIILFIGGLATIGAASRVLTQLKKPALKPFNSEIEVKDSLIEYKRNKMIENWVNYNYREVNKIEEAVGSISNQIWTGIVMLLLGTIIIMTAYFVEPGAGLAVLGGYIWIQLFSLSGFESDKGLSEIVPLKVPDVDWDHFRRIIFILYTIILLVLLTILSQILGL